MSKIKLKTNIYEMSDKYLLEIEILSQELILGIEYKTNDMKISTKSYPGLIGNHIYLRGVNNSKDDYLAIREFDTREGAEIFLKEILESIKKFCEYEETLH